MEDVIEKSKSAPPQHAFELRIVIGASDWDSARRFIREIASHLSEREPEEVGCSSGSYSGCYSIDLSRRDITPQEYRDELELWHTGRSL